MPQSDVGPVIAFVASKPAAKSAAEQVDHDRLQLARLRLCRPPDVQGQAILPRRVTRGLCR
eukprot:CAMPEP_0183568168 /NCGR_PEP_ID=MMETSP0371-20130417/116408_1 /TAXON_ID=268820 /ORGANISM="Peridinium aciculiferum, Strain PAER-2" /LENGTH=60 /DNA_ID=CAMNT_0025777633 /DNA_START=140 /DNA_END=318 /DNA_ORIENTATION=+